MDVTTQSMDESNVGKIQEDADVSTENELEEESEKLVTENKDGVMEVNDVPEVTETVSESTEATPENDEEIVLPEILPPTPQSAFVNNISVFCFSQQGESHVKKNIPCQDRSGIRIINGKLVATAIADGVGSCVLSDYGAETAVNAGLSYLEEYFEEEMKQENFVFDNPTKMGKMLRDMMSFAYTSVEKKALEMEQLLFSLQSTLTIAVYDGKTLYFAHAGDDGIVALNSEGTYAMVTSRHKGDEASSVYPLQSKNTWQFGKVDNTVAFVMATDGVLDAFVRPATENNRVYYPFVEPVFYTTQKNEEEAHKTCEDWCEYMASTTYRCSVTDDLSFVGVVNQADIVNTIKPVFNVAEWDKQTKEYQKKRQEALYPPKPVVKNNEGPTDEDKSMKPLPAKRPSGAQYRRTSDILVHSGKKEVRDAECSETVKKQREAMKKAGEGLMELASISAAAIAEGVGKATIYLGETIEQVSQEMKQRAYLSSDDVIDDHNKES